MTALLALASACGDAATTKQSNDSISVLTFTGSAVPVNGTWKSLCLPLSANSSAIITLTITATTALNTVAGYADTTCTTAAGGPISTGETVIAAGTKNAVTWSGTAPSGAPSTLNVTKIIIHSSTGSANTIAVIDASPTPQLLYIVLQPGILGTDGFPLQLDPLQVLTKQ